MNDDPDDDNKRRWLSRLLSRLNPRLRPSQNDRRFLNAAEVAYRHGWKPEPLAEGIEARGYEGTRNPIILVIERLEELAPTPPATIDSTYEPGSEAHCGKRACLCDHTECFKGWLEMDPAPAYRITPTGDRTPVTHGGRTVMYPRTAPCQTCRPQLAQRINHIPPPGQRTPADMAAIRADRTLP